MKLYQILRERGISMPKLSELSGVSYYTIYKCCKRGTTPTVPNAKKFAKAIGIPWYIFFEDGETNED